jgi:hypothetical protein
MKRRNFVSVSAKLVPGLRLRENRVAERSRVEPALFRIADLEDQFHTFKNSYFRGNGIASPRFIDPPPSLT